MLNTCITFILININYRCWSYIRYEITVNCLFFFLNNRILFSLQALKLTIIGGFYAPFDNSLAAEFYLF